MVEKKKKITATAVNEAGRGVSWSRHGGRVTPETILKPLQQKLASVSEANVSKKLQTTQRNRGGAKRKKGKLTIGRREWRRALDREHSLGQERRRTKIYDRGGGLQLNEKHKSNRNQLNRDDRGRIKKAGAGFETKGGRKLLDKYDTKKGKKRKKKGEEKLLL